MLNFKTGSAMAVAAALAVSPVCAEGTLTPGKPAGVREAARHSPNLLLIGGAAALTVAGVAIAVAQSNNAPCGSACDNSAVGTTS